MWGRRWIGRGGWSRRTGVIRSLRRRERLVEVVDDVFGVLDADAEADHLGPHARLRLLVGGHLPVGGRRGMARERLRVAHVDEPRDQPERVVELLARLEAALHAEGQERARAAAEIFLRQLV